MEWFFIAVSTGSAGVSLIWALTLRSQKNKIQRRYGPALNVDEYVQVENERIKGLEEAGRKEIEADKKKVSEYLNTERSKLDRKADEQMRDIADKKIKLRNELQMRKEKFETELSAAENYLNKIKNNITEEELRLRELGKAIEEERGIFEREREGLAGEIETLTNQIKFFHESEESLLSELGYYERTYEFEEFEQYKNELETIRKKKKELLRLDIDEPGSAVYRKGNWNLNLPAKDAKAFQKKVAKLMMRAFNGECDGFVARVNYKNIDLMIKRIINSHAVINKTVYKQFMTRISLPYRDLWISELKLAFEFEEWKQREKEEQARIRDQIREEERAARELEEAKREAELEARRNAEALEKARIEVSGANEQQKTKLLAQIAELEKRMEEMEEKNRYISQAMLTKTGHVYIISNVGSFGNEILKIGMTRRLEPMDRVKELGDASVPFPFDVHAMIRTTDAPSLENALHRHFDERRVNLENNRKEFFYVTVDEIKRELEALKVELNIEADIHITMAAEAKQWRMSQAKRQHLERSYES